MIAAARRRIARMFRHHPVPPTIPPIPPVRPVGVPVTAEDRRIRQQAEIDKVRRLDRADAAIREAMSQAGAAVVGYSGPERRNHPR